MQGGLTKDESEQWEAKIMCNPNNNVDEDEWTRLRMTASKLDQQLMRLR